MSVILDFLVVFWCFFILLVQSSIIDHGGNHGYSLSFSQPDQYASMTDYFEDASYWPKKQLTVSAWIRFSSLPIYRTFSLSLTVSGDSNQAQPFNFILIDGRLMLSYNLAAQGFRCELGNLNLWDYWSKFTITYNASDTSNVYLNGSLYCNNTVTSATYRFADSGTLAIGGYAYSSSSMGNKDRFIGWIDDLAFYNRLLTPSEINSTWFMTPDTSDSSLILYYNFDDGPTATTFQNLGTAGSSCDLVNGKILSAPFFLEANSQTVRNVIKATISPGAPITLRSAAYATTPLVFSSDVGVLTSLTISCPNPSHTPSSVSITSQDGSGDFYIYPNNTSPSTLPFSPLFNGGRTIYYKSTTPGMETVDYSCTCGGSIVTSYFEVLIADLPVASSDLSFVLVANHQLVIFLAGSQTYGGKLNGEISSLPTHGSLYQLQYHNNLSPVIKITSVPTNLTNELMGTIYVPDADFSGDDSFEFRVYHEHTRSDVSTAKISVQTWDYVPISSSNTLTIHNRAETIIDLSALDSQQLNYLGLYITSLPTKGTLYQRNSDGSRGAIIDKQFSPYVQTQPIFQYAQRVLNVSSFWGGSDDWAPMQILGPQDCFAYGDCTKSWCSLTIDGNDGLEVGSNGKGLNFKNNPGLDFELYGYTEYVEVEYDQNVYVSDILIGENRGMGSVRNILAKDINGEWMTIYSQPVDTRIQALYDKFAQYRSFKPDVCATPFLTNKIRLELDTRTAADWNEIDFIRMGGTLTPDESMVNWFGTGAWSVIYVPDPDASGLDTFTFSANDCPTNAQRWSSPSTITMNLIPTGVAGTLSVSHSSSTPIDLGMWSRNSTHVSSPPSSFTITALPSSGYLTSTSDDMKITSVPASFSSSSINLKYVPDSSCQQTSTSFSYRTSDPTGQTPVTVNLALECPRYCGSTDMEHTIQDTCTNGIRDIIFNWNQTSLDNDECVPGPDFKLRSNYHIPCGEVSFDSVAFIPMVIFALITAFVGGVFILVFYTHRNAKMTKLIQPGLSTLNILGGIAFQFSWLSYLGPLNETNCMRRPWLLALSSSIMLGALVRKIRIVVEIMRSTKVRGRTGSFSVTPQHSQHSGYENQSPAAGQLGDTTTATAAATPKQFDLLATLKSYYSDRKLSKTFIYLFVFVAIDILILAPWTRLTPSGPSSQVFQVTGLGSVSVENYQCNSRADSSLTFLLLAYKAILVLGGAYTLYMIRSLDHLLGSSSIIYSLFDFLACGALLVVIRLLANIPASIWIIIVSAVSCFAILFMFFVQYSSKVWFLLFKDASVGTVEDQGDLEAYLIRHHQATLKEAELAASHSLLPIHKAIAENLPSSQILQIFRANPELSLKLDCEEHSAFDLALINRTKVNQQLLFELLHFSLPFDRETKRYHVLSSHHNFAWVNAIQLPDENIVAVVEKILAENLEFVTLLAEAEDVRGKKAFEIASPECKAALLRRVYLFGRFEILSTEHKSSSTCVVLARDHDSKEIQTEKNSSHQHLVALKFMRNKDQFLREKGFRESMNFYKMYVVSGMDYFDGDGATLSDVNFHKDCILKGYGEYPYCVVLEAGEETLKKHIDSQQIAGKDWDQIKLIFKDLVSAIIHLHQKGLVHGDIKPNNIARIGRHVKLFDLDASARIGKDYVGAKCSSLYVPPEFIHSKTTTSKKGGEPTAVLRTYTSDPNTAQPWKGNKYDYELLLADPTFDLWSLGMTLFYMCTGSTIFQTTPEDDFFDLSDMASLISSNKDESLFRNKLSRVHNKFARNLISLLLTTNPAKRITLNRVLTHPFITGKQPVRIHGESATFDVFLSYRVDSDKQHVEKIYNLLIAQGLRVWWDQKCLQAGERWEDGFMDGLLKSASFVCLLSRGAINNSSSPKCNFSLLDENSPCDNVLLEWRLALELKEMGLIHKIFPIMIGDEISSNHYTKYFKSNCHPQVKDICVRSVEEKLLSHFERQGLGSPLTTQMTVKSILSAVTDNQGAFLEGELNECLESIGKKIQLMVNSIVSLNTSTTSSFMYGSLESPGDTPSGKQHHGFFREMSTSSSIGGSFVSNITEPFSTIEEETSDIPSLPMGEGDTPLSSGGGGGVGVGSGNNGGNNGTIKNSKSTPSLLRQSTSSTISMSTFSSFQLPLDERLDIETEQDPEKLRLQLMKIMKYFKDQQTTTIQRNNKFN